MIKIKGRFSEIYDALPSRSGIAPKTRWVNEIAEICKVSPTTVRCWLYGDQRPDALRQDLIAKHLGVEVEELF